MKNSSNAVNEFCDILKGYDTEYVFCEGRVSSSNPVRISIAGAAVNADGEKVKKVGGVPLAEGNKVVMMISKKTGSVYILGVLE